MEKPMTGKQVALTRRTLVAGVTTGGAALSGLCAPFVRLARAASTTIRYATGGGSGPQLKRAAINFRGRQKNGLTSSGKAITDHMAFTPRTTAAGTPLRHRRA